MRGAVIVMLFLVMSQSFCKFRDPGELLRPFYLLGHMVNTIEEIELYIAMGANGFEVDINFNSSGQPTILFHGYQNRCGRNAFLQERFDKYLDYLRRVTTPGDDLYCDTLFLLYLDCKISHLSDEQKYLAGKHLATTLIENIYHKNSELYVIVAPPHPKDVKLVKGFLKAMKAHNATDILAKYIGWDLGHFDSSKQIQKTFASLNLSNVWVADGDFRCERPIPGPRKHLKDMIDARNKKTSVVKKVIQWTVDIDSVVQETLRLGVDSIMTNWPENVLKSLCSEPYRNQYRLATKYDNPWEKVVI